MNSLGWESYPIVEVVVALSLWYVLVIVTCERNLISFNRTSNTWKLPYWHFKREKHNICCFSILSWLGAILKTSAKQHFGIILVFAGWLPVLKIYNSYFPPIYPWNWGKMHKLFSRILTCPINEWINMVNCHKSVVTSQNIYDFCPSEALVKGKCHWICSEVLLTFTGCLLENLATMLLGILMRVCHQGIADAYVSMQPVLNATGNWKLIIGEKEWWVIIIVEWSK